MANPQNVLKPQDLLVTLKLAVRKNVPFTFALLAAELDLSSSEVHACVTRASRSGLMTSVNGSPEIVRLSVEEFVLHGVRYAFPATYGPVARGLLTGGAGPVLRDHFAHDSSSSFVWPSANGTTRAASLYPLYPSVPTAATYDFELYEVLTLVDAIRAGSARERELAEIEFRRRLR